MTNDAEAEGNRGEGSRAAVRPRTVTWAALAGSLIGALTGLAGSFLVYKQSEDTREAAADQRISNIRRSAYTDIVNGFENFKTEANGARNFWVAPEATQEEAESQYNDKYVPAYKALVQAQALTRLVGTESARASIKKMTPLQEEVGGYFVLEDGDYFDVENYDSAMKKFTEIVDAFVEKVDEEVV
ncbi:hypothetical protein ACOAKG_22840 [Streptomyces sp. JL3001]|uniref:hypothetical protein n=1 Tax=Streptomyces sp. JL3001 TaxID=3400923 RepID=UPI003B284E48